MATTLQLLETAEGWRRADGRVTLVHVARTWGSAPRPPGSLLAVRANGEHIGSVSGGCVEAELLAQLQAAPLTATTRLLYSRDSHPHARLPCGGQLELVVEPLQGADCLRPLIEAITTRTPLRRRLHVDSGAVELQSGTIEALAPHHYDGRTLEEGYGPSWRALLIGANDLAQQVARQCLALEFEVWVCDPRAEYRCQWREPLTRLTAAMPDEAVTDLALDPYSAVLALTHDPKLDDMALVPALQGPAFYVGALGSRRSAERRRDTLRQMGVAEAAIDRLDAPIGLNLGSRTPAEIAVAIAAKLIQTRSALRQTQGRLRAATA